MSGCKVREEERLFPVSTHFLSSSMWTTATYECLQQRRSR